MESANAGEGKYEQVVKLTAEQEDVSELKSIVENDIIGNINRNVELGNIKQEAFT